MVDINDPVSFIGETQLYFKLQAQCKANTGLTLRNWLFGFYIAGDELNGTGSAEYRQKILKEFAQRVKHISAMPERNLSWFKSFYFAYPQILQSLTAKFNGAEKTAVESVYDPSYPINV
ncbi:MAG: hypothetical protein ABI707_10815 [Ferruginibacter sp.]